jgi:hypothetical protein
MLPLDLAEALVEELGTEAEVLFSNISSTGHWSVYVELPNGKHQYLHGTFDSTGYWKGG